MNISNMRVAVRPMSTSQAVDLGTMLARHWFVPLWKIWLGTAWPFFMLLYLPLLLLGSEQHPWLPLLGAFLFWWCKPLYEKPMLTWLGYALFDEQYGEHDVKNSILTGYKTLHHYSVTLLLTRRLSTHRQLLLPVLLLEHPNKQQLKQRASILSRGQGNGLTWHTVILLHLETLLYFGVLIVIAELIPTALMSSETYFHYLQYTSFWADMALAFLYFFAVSVIAPFFVAGGFAVYLTKRCLLEGWDVELTFKQLAQRYEQSQANPLQVLARLKNKDKTL